MELEMALEEGLCFCIYMRACVRERERGRQRDRQTKRDTKKKTTFNHQTGEKQ